MGLNGNVGNHNSGRKTKAVEIERAVECELEKITEKTLIDLANKRVNEHINNPLSFEKTAKMALPIVLRGMAEKHVNVEMTLEDLLNKNFKRMEENGEGSQ